MYKTEQKFSEALIRSLKHVPLIQRIESGRMGRGIPDIYLRVPNGECWIETKNDFQQSIYLTSTFQISWRAGQQGWHTNYYLASGKKRYVLTICSMKDGFVIIKGIKRYIDNIVPVGDCIICTELKDLPGIILSSIENN